MEALHKEMDRLKTILDEISGTGKDEFGDLTAAQLAEVNASRRALDAAKITLICIQGYAPYGR